MRPLTPLAALAVLLPACVPDRDNRFDPVNKPDAEISVSLQGLQAEWVPRHAEVLLDASASTPAGNLLVTWYERPAPNASTPDPAWTAISAEIPVGSPLPFRFTHVASFRDGENPGQPQGVALREVKAAVRDPDTNGADEAIASIRIFNRAPTIQTETLREFPNGGMWWNGSGKYQATIVAVPDDVDDLVDPSHREPMTVEWEFIGGARIDEIPAGTVVTGSAQTISIPTVESSAILRVTARDAAGSQTSEFIDLVVQPQIWMLDQGRITRVPPPLDYIETLNPTILLGAGTSATGQHDVWTIQHPFAGWTITRVDQFGTGAKDDVPLPYSLPTWAVSGASSGVAGAGAWALLSDGAGQRLVHVRASAPDTLAADVAVGQRVPTPADVVPRTLAPASAIDDSIWLLFRSGTTIYVERREAAGAAVQPPIAMVCGVTGLRPLGIESDRAGGFFLLCSSDDPTLIPRIIHFGANGLSTGMVDLPQTRRAQLLAWDAERTQMAVSGGTQLAGYYQVLLLQDGAAQVVLHVDQTVPPSDLRFDVPTGGLWVSSGSSGYVRKVRVDGEVMRTYAFTSPSPLQPMAVDETIGGAWVYDVVATRERIVRLPSVPETQPASNGDYGQVGDLAVMPLHSRLLAAAGLEGTLAMLDGNAVVMDSLSVIQAPTPISPAGVGSIAVDPSDDTIWFSSPFVAGTGGESRLFRLRTGTPPEEIQVPPMMASIGDIAVDPGTGDVCVGGSTGSGAPGDRAIVVRIDATGTEVYAAAIGDANGTAAVAEMRVSPETGECVYLGGFADAGAEQHVGRVVDETTFVDRRLGDYAASFDGARDLEISRTGSAFFLDSQGDAVVRVELGTGAVCSGAACFLTMLDLPATDIYSNVAYEGAQDLAIDPVTNRVLLSLETPPAIADLGFAGAPGTRILSVIPASAPTKITFNR